MCFEKKKKKKSVLKKGFKSSTFMTIKDTRVQLTTVVK